MLCALLLQAAASLGPGPGDAAPERGIPAWIRCTPTTIEVAGEDVRTVDNPLARALEEAGPGSFVHLDAGDYPPFTIGMDSGSPNDSKTSGGQPGLPIFVTGGGFTRIVGTGGDAIGIDQRNRNGYITFHGLTIVPGQRSGVLFFRQSGAVHRGYSFEDCHILGTYDHTIGRGGKSKWGISAHSVAEFRFVGVTAPARIQNIEKEHAFYIQNHRGSVLIENVQAFGLGRTFCQFTARTGEGRPGTGDITIRDCDVRDACVARGDGFKGGSAFTFAGSLQGTILLENNVYRAGFAPAFAKLTRPGDPYGTGALVAWQEKRAGANGRLVLRGNRFLFADGCGDRPVVSIGGCALVDLEGVNEIRSGGAWPALALDPLQNGALVSPRNGGVRVDPRTKLTGALTVEGKTRSLAEVSGRAEPPEARPADAGGADDPPGESSGGSRRVR